MVTKALLEVSIEGLGPNRTTAIFPCGIFQYMRGVNDKPGTPNYDLKRLAIKSTASRIYPNFANCDWSSNQKWIDLDRKMKQDYIDSLDKETYDKLKSILDKDPDVAYKLGLEIVD